MMDQKRMPHKDSVKAVMEVFMKHCQKRRFYTMGTGLTTKEAFIKRLRDIREMVKADAMLPDRISLVDIRRKWSGSRNGKWCYWEHLPSAFRLFNIEVDSRPVLSNTFGATQAALREYRDHLHSNGKIVGFLRVFPEYSSIKARIERRAVTVILLCSERKAFKKNGKSWNCHRVPLSLELLEALGDTWEVEHL